MTADPEPKVLTPRERVELYMSLVNCASVGAEIVYDERFRSPRWPRTAYALEKADLGQVLLELDLAQDKCRELEMEHEDPVLGWTTAAVEAEGYEREHTLLGQIVRLVHDKGSRELRDEMDRMVFAVPDPMADPERPGLVEELRQARVALKQAETESTLQRQDIEDLTNAREDLVALRDKLVRKLNAVEGSVEDTRRNLALFLGDGLHVGKATADNVAQDLLRGLPGIPEPGEGERPNG